MKDIDMNFNLMAKADEFFTTWETGQYPNGDSPLSDSDRLLFIMGWIQGYKFLNDNGEKHDQNLLRTL
jgi:hypothetical protein